MPNPNPIPVPIPIPNFESLFPAPEVDTSASGADEQEADEQDQAATSLVPQEAEEGEEDAIEAASSLEASTDHTPPSRSSPQDAGERGGWGGGVGAARKGMEESNSAETDADRSVGRLGAGATVGEEKGCFPCAVAWGSAEDRDAALVSLRAALAHVRLP